MEETLWEKMIKRYGEAKSYKLDFDKISEGSELILGCFDIPVTTRCTLKCKNCSSLMPYYEQASDLNMDVLIQDVARLLDVVDYVARVNVLGGEPFLHRGLYSLLKYLNNSSKIEKVRVITNGTVVPSYSPELVGELSNPKIQVRISNYNLDRTNVERLIAFLDKNKIKFTLKEFGDDDFLWYDFGDFTKRNRSKEELQNQKDCCDVEWYSLFNGKLFCCPRAAHATDIQLIPDSSSNYFDLNNIIPNSKEASQKLLSEFIMGNSFYDACDYCDRGTEKCNITKVAEQM